jgi:hypothetical protein
VDNSKTYGQMVYVDNSYTQKGNNQTAAPQSATVVLSSYRQGSSPSTLKIVGAVVAIGLVVSLGLLKPLKRLKKPGPVLSQNLL